MRDVISSNKDLEFQGHDSRQDPIYNWRVSQIKSDSQGHPPQMFEVRGSLCKKWPWLRKVSSHLPFHGTRQRIRVPLMVSCYGQLQAGEGCVMRFALLSLLFFHLLMFSCVWLSVWGLHFE